MVRTAGASMLFAWGIFIFFHVITEVHSSACTTDNTTIVISFPELDPPHAPSFSDPIYIQDVLTDGAEPDLTRIVVNNENKSSGYLFDEYFQPGWNNVTKKYYVQMIKAINRDDNTASTEDNVNILQYQFVCYEPSVTSAFYKVLKIQILDVNDNAPTFINSPYSISVNELTPIGVMVFRGISATDLDEGANKEIYYSFNTSSSQFNFNGTTYFYLPSPQEGIVAVLDSLDFESMYRLTGNASMTYYDLTVTARDNAENVAARKSSQTNIRILILDGDDQGPEFVYPSCIQSSQPNSKSCIRPKYLSSIPSGSSTEITLALIPDPPDASNPTVLMLMQDRDTLNSVVTCRISKTEPPGYENYFTASYSLNSGKQHKCEIKKIAGQILYRTNATSLEIVIEAIEQSPNFRVDYATVVVSIQPTNINAPIITYNSNIGYIYENSPVGSRAFIDSTANTTLMRLTFTDPDKSASDPQPLFDITVNNGNLFSVTQDGYVVLNNARLDYETAKQYIFTVTVTKSGSSSSTSATVTINVLDINDNNPIFSTPDSYIVSVSQGDYSSSSKPLVTVSATDVDFGPPLYSISRVVPSNSTNKFIINNGLVTLRSSVNAGEVYTIYVSATDQGNPIRSTEAVVIVTVTPLINQIPSFSYARYVIYISEGVLVGSSLFTLPVSDADTPLSLLTYSLSNESPSQAISFFTTNGSTLINARSFDRENISQHNITVTVSDPQFNTAQAQVTVIVTEVNDNDPSFTTPAYAFSVAEGQPTGTSLGTVFASDNDQPSSPNSIVSYSIVTATDSNLFSINSVNGLMTTNYVFDYEAKKQYLIFVRAADNGSPSRASVVPVTVNIIDVDDNVPLFEETSREVYVQENVINAEVVSLNATDADSSPNISFILSNIGGSTDASTFNVQTIGNQARITVNGALDYETKILYQFLLTTAAGQNTVFGTVKITVHVLDVNDRAPVIGSFSSTVTVLENVAIGYLLQTIPATDADATAPNNIVRYNIISTNPNSNLFYIGEKTGQLVVANSLQLERTINLYTVIVGASDMGLSPLSSSATVTISITRNRPPSFNPSSFTTSPVNENVSANSVITSVTATDPDTGVTPQFANLVYSLLPDSRLTNIFQIDSASGTVRTTSSLTSLTDLSFVLGVIATDAGGLTATASVTVPINRNLNNPEFLQLAYTQEIPENFPLGDSVIQLSARDLDLNSPWNSLQYTIDSDILSQQYFKVNDAGILLLTKSLALTGITEFNMIVSLKDKGTPPRSATATATVKVTVTRNLLNPIFFNETYRVTIPETQAIGSIIIKVSATDADIKYNKLVYSIEGDQSAVSYFKINSSTGEISTNQTLLNTPMNSFVIRVAATDDGPVARRGTALVFVDVVKNFQRPVWVSGTFTTSILENTAAGVSVLRVSATDADIQPPNNEIDYYITSGGEYFQVNSATGVISVKVPPYTDTSNVSTYQVTLIARDRGTPSLQSEPLNVTIAVQRNLYAPRWLATPYNFNLKLSASDNDLIQTLTAIDGDTSPFNLMSFDIIPYSGSSSSLFKFVNGNSATGSVELRVTNGNSLNSDTQTQYYLYVRVQDNGTPSKYDIALISIYANRNLNPPNFPTTSKTINITENTPPGDIVSNCLAVDNDPGPNGQIVYSLVSSIPASTYFQVVENTGNIFVQRDLYQDRSSPYFVVITAQDKGTPPLAAVTTCTVTINVNRNLHAPVFVNTPYDRTLNTNVVSGASVVTVTATDADSVIPFNTITYEIVRQTVDGAFILNRNTGVLTVNSSLTQSSYTIAVRTSDGGNPPLSAYNVFVVTVNGNLQTPEFQNPGPTDSYKKTVEVLETQSVLNTITNVLAVDGDSGAAGAVSYFLVGDNQASIYFQVNSVSGAINLRTSLLQDSATVYTLNIIARDNDPTPRYSTTTATVTVSVYRNRFTPLFDNQNCSRLVDENLGIGQILTTVTAIDSDRQNTFENVSYETIGDGDALGFAQLNNGVVTLRSSLSNTASTALYLRIRAYDNGVPPKSSTTVCTISINKNLNTPVWVGVGINSNNPQYTYTISEDQALYVPFGQLSATDADTLPPYNTVNFYYNPSNQLALEYFRVTPDGDVAAIKTLIGSSSSTYSWTMGLNDRGPSPRYNPVTATVTVNVIRNNNVPVFNNCPPTSTVNILENAPVGTRLFQLTPTDSDPPNTRYGNITVQIIGDENAVSNFNLDSQNYVVLNRVLTSDTSTRYQLRVQVADQGVPSKSSVCVVPINVNRNINTPKFRKNVYNITILEIQPVASIIDVITADDNDRISPYNQISYSFGSDLLLSNAGNYFTIMTSINLGQILVLRNLMLDNSKATNYQFTVFATDGGGLRGSAVVNVNVIRNTAPRISNLDGNITINHNISSGSEVYNVNFIDPDTRSPFNETTFSLTGEMSSFSYFQINPNSGVINLIQSLVGSGPDLFIVIVKVCDGGNLCDSKTLYINVVRNFVPPTFNEANYETTIYEDISVLTSILKVQAVDSDLAPPYNRFTYRILNSNVSFNVESDTGNIFVKKPLTGETYSSVTFNIVAEDGGNKVSVPISVKVNIIRNNFPPVFTTSSCNVAINANIAAGASVFIVSATDSDPNSQFGGDSVRYRIIGDDGAPSFFTIIDDKIGEITALSGISSNNADTYKLRIEARDGLQKTDVKVCTVTVTRNLNNPFFSPSSYSARILETHQTGTSVAQVFITDVDASAPSNQGYFTLAGNTQCTDYFQINDFTGVISPKTVLRLNTLKPLTYTCTVTGSDRGVPPRNATNSATVTITVIYNTAPFFDKEVYIANITRITGDNTPLFTYTVTDNDVDSPFNVLSVFISGGPDAKYFALNQFNQTVIRNTADLALESDTKYEVFITVSDGGSPPLSDSAVAILYVNRNIEAPICTSQSIITINYTQPLGVPIVVLNATDRDTMPPMNTVTYTLVGQGETLQYMLIDTSTGSLSLKRPLPSSNLAGLLVQVVARDGGFPSLSSTCSVQINIQRDSNTLAFTLNDWRATIPETTAVNTSIITVSASPTPNIIYSVIGTDTAPTYFNINSITGQVYVLNNLTRDLSKRLIYYLLVKAVKTFEVTTQDATATVTITVERNLNPPVLANSRFETTINDDAFIGTSTIQIIASDADNDPLLYTVQAPTNGSDYFAVSKTTGLIEVAKPLTSIPTKLVQFNVIVNDQSSVNPKSATATIVINIVPDQPPTFVNPNTYFKDIIFTQPVNSNIFQVSAVDPDLKGRIVYELCGQRSAPSYFQVDNTNGSIYVISSLTTDITTTYQLCLIAYDSVRPNNRATATLTISVNRNPNKPVFLQTNYNATVYETASFGTLLFIVSASDADGQNVEYKVSSSTPSSCVNYFNLHPNTGRFTTSGDLYQTRPATTCTFQFTVNDVATPSLSSDLTAAGVITFVRNDFAPSFPSAEYTITINETLTFPTQVFQVNATDQDAPEPNFGQIEYIGIGDDAVSSFFTLNNTSGAVTLYSSLRTDNTLRYNFRIVARDNGQPRLSATTLLHININRNMYPPIINNNQGRLNITVYEDDSIANPVFQLNYVDQDRAGPQQDVTWSLLPDTAAEKSFFYVTQQGQVYISLPLFYDSSKKSPYTFTVPATNNDGSGKSGSILCSVYVIRNLYAPRFSQAVYSVTISRAATLPFTINVPISATDNDTYARYQVQRYEIVNDGLYSQLFSMNPTTSELTLIQSVDQRTENSYKIEIRALDGGSPKLSGEATVLVNVNRNLYRPEFVNIPRTVYLFEDQSQSEVARVTARDNDTQAPYNQIYFTQVTNSAYYDTDSLGRIYLKTRLDVAGSPDNSTIQIRVCDQAPQPLCALQDAFVVFIVIRNHAPYFLNTPYTNNLLSLSVGDNVINATARDDDSNTTRFGQISFDLIGDDGAENQFIIDRNTGRITVANGIAGSQGNVFRIRIRVCDGGNLCATTVAIVSVSGNQYNPHLDKASYSQTIPETQPYGDTIITVTVTDSDATAPNNLVECELLNGTTNDRSLDCFAVNPTFYLIFAKRSLIESPCNISNQYNFKVQCSDKGTPPLTSTISDVAITVTRNQSPPRWDRPVYSFTIPRNTTVNTIVGTIRATDNDALIPFGTLSYSLIGGANGNAYFRLNKIDNNNVNVILSNPFSNTLESNYQIFALVQDSGSPPRQDLAEVNIFVNQDLNAPYFTQLLYIFETSEDINLGETIGSLFGADNDIASPWKDYYFRLTSAHPFFAVTTNGIVYAHTDLQLDTTYNELYTLTAQIYDGGIPSLNGSQTATITIKVNRNRNCPRFLNLPNTISINRNITVDSVIYTVQASDNDTNIGYNRKTVQLHNDNNVLNYFNFNVNTRTVAVLSPLASSTASQYVLTFIARYGYCEPTPISTLTVNVVRNLSPPQWSKNSGTITVLEIQDTSVSMFNLNTFASDSDGGTILFEFASNSLNTSLIHLDTQGHVYLNKQFFTHSEDTHAFQFQLKDEGGLISSIFTLTIKVIRNTAPHFTNTNLYYTNIRKNHVEGTPVFTVTVEDVDSDLLSCQEQSLRIRGKGNAPSFFSINENGIISLNYGANLSMVLVYNFTILVEVRDGGVPSLSAEAMVYITVERNLFSPVLASQSFQVPKTASPGYIITTLTATDGDLMGTEGTVNYEIISGSLVDDITYLNLNKTTGVLSLINNTKLNDIDAFSLTVRVYDLGIPSLDYIAVIDIVILGDNTSLTVQNYSWAIPENVAIGTVVGIVQALPNDGVNYSTVGFPPATSFFAINETTGQVLVIRNLTNELLANYTLKVKVIRHSHQIVQTALSTVEINVFKNLHAPVFNRSQYEVSVHDTTSIGSTILVVTAVDADGDVVEYSLKSENSSFYIHPLSGVIILTTSLVNYKSVNFTFNVYAQDNGVPSKSGVANVTVHIKKLFINDNCPVNPLQSNFYPPTITPSSDIGYIYENSPIGSRVFNDITTSKLLWLDIQYPNTSCSSKLGIFVEPESPFQVTQDGYFQVINDTLDFEITKQYNLVVTIIGTTASVTIIINILNVNDNSPVIKNDNPIVFLPQGEYRLCRVMQLQATDLDFGPITFIISKVHPLVSSNKFSVTSNGDLTFRGIISPVDVYAVYITAMDRGTPSRSTDAFVVVMGNSTSNSTQCEIGKLNNRAEIAISDVPLQLGLELSKLISC